MLAMSDNDFPAEAGTSIFSWTTDLVSHREEGGLRGAANSQLAACFVNLAEVETRQEQPVPTH